MALHAEDWETINGCLPRLYRELDSRKNFQVMLEILNELVPADSLAVNVINLRQPRQLSAVSLPENHATAEQVSLIGQHVHESPFTAYFLATLDCRWKMTTDFVPLEDFHQTNLHRLALAPLGIDRQMCAGLGVLGETGYGIVINRRRRAFTERDRELLNAIQPHLVTSFINAAVHGRAQSSISELRAAMEAVPGAYGHFDGEGRVSWMQERAAAWLAEFFDDEVKTDGGIPRSLGRMLEESRLKGGQQLEKVAGGECLIVCLGSSPTGGWLLRLERRPAVTPSHFHPLPQLSARKNEVLQWMVEGKRNAEIGAILGLSPRTVEKHVQEILAALGVENRATAIVRAMEYCVAVRQGTGAALAPGR